MPELPSRRETLQGMVSPSSLPLSPSPQPLPTISHYVHLTHAADSPPLFLNALDWQRELTRLGVTDNQWRISEANKEFLICDRYTPEPLQTTNEMFPLVTTVSVLILWSLRMPQTVLLTMLPLFTTATGCLSGAGPTHILESH